MDEFFLFNNHRKSAQVALAGQTAGRIRVVLDFLFLLHQGKRKIKKIPLEIILMMLSIN
jgi:hypothetical protein